MGVAPHKSGIESDNDLECFGYVLTLYFRVPVTKWCYIYVENHLSTIYWRGSDADEARCVSHLHMIV